MSPSKKIFVIYFLAGLLPVAMFLIPSFNSRLILHETVLNVLPYIPYVGFALAGILGWRLNQTRILLTALLFLGACYAMIHPALFLKLKIGAMELNQILCIAVPVMLAATFICKESRMLGLRSLVRILFLLTPLLALACWLLYWPASFQKMVSRGFFPLGNFLIIPQMTIISISILGFIAVLSRDKKIKPFIQAATIALIPFLSAAQVGMTSGADAGLMTIHILAAFSIASFIHLHAIFSMYWQRVYVDELTQIPNRRALDEHLQTLSGEYMIAMMDIDHFKHFNDKYGHDEGDNVLKMVGKSLKDDMGNAFRYGGEEFFAVFEGRDYENAFSIADRARQNLAKREFFIRPPVKVRKKSSNKNRGKGKPRDKKVRVTVSIGLAHSDYGSVDPSRVMKCADQALYKAKNQGRNCVVTYG